MTSATSPRCPETHRAAKTAYDKGCRCIVCRSAAADRRRRQKEAKGIVVMQRRTTSHGASADAAERLRQHPGTVLALVESGATWKEIAAAAGLSLRGVRDVLESDELRQHFEAAKRISAEAHIERAERLLREAAEEGTRLTSAQAQIAKSRSEHHRWIASVRDRQEYSDKPQMQVNVSFGSLFLEALRAVGHSAGMLSSGADEEVIEADWSEV